MECGEKSDVKIHIFNSFKAKTAFYYPTDNYHAVRGGHLRYWARYFGIAESDFFTDKQNTASGYLRFLRYL